MIDVAQEARDALNEVMRGLGFCRYWTPDDARGRYYVIEAMCRQIEKRRAVEAELEALKRDMSDAVKRARQEGSWSSNLSRFILPEPVDPLVELLSLMMDRSLTDDDAKHNAEWLSEQLAKRGLTIKEQNP